MKHRPKTDEYIVYKGENFVCMGTVVECAEQMGIKINSFKFYLTPTYKNRILRRKKSKNSVSVEKVEDDE